LSRLDDLVGAAFAGDLASISGAAVGEPRPVAACRAGDRGAVLSLVRWADGSLNAIVAGAWPRANGGWEAGDVGESPWIDERPGTLVQLGSMRLDRMEIAHGAAPPGTDQVRGSLLGQTVTVDAHPETGAFVVAFLAPEDSGPIELTAAG
jgi:hypothetical protein